MLRFLLTVTGEVQVYEIPTLGSPKGGVTIIRKVCQLMERCDGWGCKGVWEDVITFKTVLWEV